MRNKLLLGFSAAFVLGLGAASSVVGCAESDSVTDGQTSRGGTGEGGSASSSSGEGGASASSSSSSGESGSSSGSSSSSGGGGGGSSSSSSSASSSGSSSSSSSSSGQIDPCQAGCPADLWDVDGNPLTGMCGCEYSCKKVSNDDPIDANFTDDNCDGSDGVAELCVYVSTSLGDDASGTGLRSAPMKTIAAAIQKAQAAQLPAVCLSGETYNESVQVVSGISIYGGFDQNNADFKFKRTMAVTTTVTAPGTVFYAPQIDAETHIEGITIQATAAAGAGESTYGARLGGGMAQLFVRFNSITVGNGSPGGNGMDGQPHQNGTAPSGNNGTAGAETNSQSGFGGQAPNCPAPGGKGGDGGENEANGQDGAPGSGGTQGGKGATWNGCTPAIGGAGPAGGDGQNGASSLQGAPGAGGNALGTVMAMGYMPANGGDGIVGVNGKAGGGAGGGGGGSGAGFCIGKWDKGGGGGSGGCGGLGGNPGKGGQGGGGSFGVFAAAGKIVVTNNEITSGNGGKGGNGGNGAAAQLGGVGGTGGGNSDDSGPGGKGGNGGKGGAGGPGGGGGGGASACLGHASTVMVNYAMNSCSTGVPGFGGTGGTNPDGGVANAGNSGTALGKLQFN